MINKITLSLLAVLLLGSCGTKLSLVKRKYNKGFYVSVNKNKHAGEKEHTASTHKRTAAHSKTTEAPVVAKAEPTTPAPTLTKPEVLAPAVVAAAMQSKPAATKHQPVITASAKHEAAAVEHKKEFKQVLSRIQNKPVKSGGQSDANLVLMVILCLFWLINLIPVYIHDGHQVTTNFWITLLLNLTYIGAVIFSILVVLDVVDLSK